MKKFKRIIASFVTALTLLAITPMAAHAEWKSDSTGWWYTEGNSYATGWRLLDGNWYYFDFNGYMAHDCYIGNYYLNSNGVWTNNVPTSNTGSSNNYSHKGNSTITIDQAKKIALDKVKAIKYPDSKVRVIIIPYFDIDDKVIEGRSGYLITVGEDNSEHTVPTARVFVDKNTGEVFDAFNVVFGIGDSKLKELA